MALRTLIGCLAALLAGAAPAVRADDAAGAVNWARQQGCARPLPSALQDDPRLREAALQLASGASLQTALSRVGYLAARAAVLRVSGGVGDTRLAALLVRQDCATLTDPGMTAMGMQRRAGELWIVIAAPVPLPAAGDATVIRQILGLVNGARAAGRRCGNKAYAPAPPLTLNADLTGAAQAHSLDMASYDEFEHSGHDGSSPALRVARAGYGGYRIVGENIAAGAMTPAEVTQGWLASPPHCENIMDPRFSEIGIGYAVNRRSAELVFWTQDFAAPRRARGDAATLQ